MKNLAGQIEPFERQRRIPALAEIRRPGILCIPRIDRTITPKKKKNQNKKTRQQPTQPNQKKKKKKRRGKTNQ
jgi:hypothetical protein